MKLTLLSRSYCSLCQKMLDALQPWREAHGFDIEVVDVDADEALVARYNELVPVLLDGDVEICHWHLDEGSCRRTCRRARKGRFPFLSAEISYFRDCCRYFLHEMLALAKLRSLAY